MQKTELIDIKELAQRTGKTTDFWYQKTHQRKIPFYKPFGKNLFFNWEEVLEVLTAKRIKPLAEIEQEATDFLTLNKRR